MLAIRCLLKRFGKGVCVGVVASLVRTFIFFASRQHTRRCIKYYKRAKVSNPYRYFPTDSLTRLFRSVEAGPQVSRVTPQSSSDFQYSSCYSEQRGWSTTGDTCHVYRSFDLEFSFVHWWGSEAPGGTFIPERVSAHNGECSLPEHSSTSLSLYGGSFFDS